MFPEDFEEISTQLAGKDPVYQALLSECLAQEAEAVQALEALPASGRAAVNAYLTLCEELEHRKAQLAATHYALHGAKVFTSAG